MALLLCDVLQFLLVALNGFQESLLLTLELRLDLLHLLQLCLHLGHAFGKDVIDVDV